MIADAVWHPPSMRRHSMAGVALVALLGCTEPAPVGTWVGELSESRNLGITEAREGDTARVRRLGGGAAGRGVQVTIRESGDDRYATELRGCALELSSDDGERLRVAGSPICQLTFEGWTGTFAVRGSGFVENGALTLQLMGSTSARDASGGFSWRFHGRRVD